MGVDLLPPVEIFVIASLGWVAANAWNNFAVKLFGMGKDSKISKLFVYALILTVVGIVTVVVIQSVIKRRKERNRLRVRNRSNAFGALPGL